MMSAIDMGEVMTLIKTMTPGVSDEAVSAAVSDWITAHPEAVTTVTDGSITEQKLASALATKINQSATAVSTLSDEIDVQERQITDGMLILTSADFEQGQWSTSSPYGVKSNSAKCIRTKNVIDVKAGDRIVTLPGTSTLYIRFEVVDDNGGLVQEVKGYYDKATITDNIYTIIGAGKLYINVANGYNYGNSSNIVPADMIATINVANTYAARETYKMLTEKELTVPWTCTQHRGYISETVHSNTLPAYYRAWKNGAEGIEVDARKASDGVYVISHDASITVDGTTYTISETPSTTLKELVLSTDPVYGDCKVPLFSDVLNLCVYTGMTCNIDCKSVNFSEIAQMVVDAGMNGKCVYSSVTPTVAADILAIDPHAGFCASYSESSVNTWDAFITSEEVRRKTILWGTTISEAALRLTRSKGFKYMLTQVTNSNNFHYNPDVIEYENTADIRTLNRQYLNSISVL